MMRVHTLMREQVLEGTPAEVFGLFADARNLEAITPPILRFEVITPGEIEMRVGTLIAYRLRLHGIPINWLTSIQAWDPPHRFIDQQVRGPYALWHHTHDLEPLGDDRTLMRDTVRYAIGFGPLGELARRLLVERDLRAIFDYRAERVAEIASTMRLTPGSSPGLSATWDQSTVRSGPTSTSARSENPAGSK
jgi:ligand-binding SRPBCC domain-containing protein